MIQSSSDGLRIEGTQFPDPDPPDTTLSFSILKSAVTCIWQARWDDATGTQTLAPLTLIIYNGGSVPANATYEDVLAEMGWTDSGG